jgi:hypothetical protein
VYPLAVSTCNDTLCTEYHSILLLIAESFESGLYLLSSISSCSFPAPAGENFVSMVVMMFVIVVMVMTAAGAVRTVIVVMFMLLIVVVVMMLMLLIVVVVMMLMLFIMVMVVMLMLFIMVMVVVMIVMSSLFKKLLQLIVKCVLLSHSVNELLACELVPLCCNDRSRGILLTQALYAVVKLILRKTACMAEYETACVGYLIIEELAEVLHVHLVLLCVNNCGKAVKFNIMSIDVLNCADNIAELAYAGRLDKDTVGSIVCKHLFKSLAEIAYETATDTA